MIASTSADDSSFGVDGATFDPTNAAAFADAAGLGGGAAGVFTAVAAAFTSESKIPIFSPSYHTVFFEVSYGCDYPPSKAAKTLYSNNNQKNKRVSTF
jgi:hypothetical protein